MDYQNPPQEGEFLFELRPAGAFSRLINYLIDAVLAPSLAAWGISLIGRLWELPALQEIAASFSFWLIFVPLHYLVGETVFQQTLGKMITGTYVARKNGSPPRFGTVVLRTLARMTPFEPLSILGRRMWHDSWTGTTVTKLPPEY